jgi:hypothetical protein
MEKFYKVNVTLYGSSPDVIYTSRRFYTYSIFKFRSDAEARGLKPATYSPEPLDDPEIIECVKIRERSYPEQWSRENLQNYDNDPE